MRLRKERCKLLQEFWQSERRRGSIRRERYKERNKSTCGELKE